MAIIDLDPLIHSRLRLAIMAALAAAGRADFNHLKRDLKATDGNLSTHLTKLEKAGYIKVIKTIADHRSKTICRLTLTGRNAYSEYLENLKSSLSL